MRMINEAVQNRGLLMAERYMESIRNRFDSILRDTNSLEKSSKNLAKAGILDKFYMRKFDEFNDLVLKAENAFHDLENEFNDSTN